ncbi:MAG TPA: glucosylceramidase [Lachnospiraceae bacterium]|nr:glucosylceramidase [Lachnospiraceae bacterium]
MKLITTCYEKKKKQTFIREYEEAAEKVNVENKVVNLYPNIEYQTVLGFGGAVTEAAGYVFSKLGEENKKRVLELYFGENGSRYNMARSHIDSCDFSLGMYAAMEDKEDRDMQSFTLARDEKYILPFLRAAEKERGESLDIMLSPWTPPAFMKTNEERAHGGKLKPEYREFWAEYICRYIEEYKREGFKVSRLTVQNEPAAVQTWDSCIYTAGEEKEFIKDALYPALVKHGLSDVKINIWDHNKERVVEWARTIIDKDTDRMIDGIAFHWYSGDHFEALKIAHELFPKKELIFTEGCVEYSRFDSDQLHNAQMYAHDIIGNLNGGMTGFLDWNLLLDEKGGPNHVQNYCDAPIMADITKDQLEVKLSYDYIGHFSRYIKKGAKRVAFTKYTSELEMTAFKNPDGEIVLVLLNPTDHTMPVNIRINGKIIEFEVHKNAIATALL